MLTFAAGQKRKRNQHRRVILLLLCCAPHPFQNNMRTSKVTLNTLHVHYSALMHPHVLALLSRQALGADLVHIFTDAVGGHDALKLSAHHILARLVKLAELRERADHACRHLRVHSHMRLLLDTHTVLICSNASYNSHKRLMVIQYSIGTGMPCRTQAWKTPVHGREGKGCPVRARSTANRMKAATP